MSCPKMRFKNFSEDWNLMKIESFSHVTSSKRVYLNDYVNEGVPFFRGKEISEIKMGKHPEDLLFISEQKYNEYKNTFGVPIKGDILVTAVGTIGNSMLVNDDQKFYFKDGNLIWLRDISENPEFVLHCFSSDLGFRRITDSASGSNQKALTISGLSKLEFFFPTAEEQQKIADFLSLLNRRIEQQQGKVETWREYKKGMMQKLFSRELRFKNEDEGEFPEWETSRLGDLGETFTGLSGKTKEDFGAGEAEFITFMNVFGNVKAKREQTEKVDLSDGKKQTPVILGDVLFTTSSETPHEVGMASVWLFDDPDVYLNSFCFGFRINTSNISSEFLVCMLRSEIYREKITLLAQGSTRFNLPRTELLNMKIEIPENVEQQKISNILSVIDNKIEAESKKVELLKEQKKGFMQQLFI